VAGAGDAVFSADVGDFHGCWGIGVRRLLDLLSFFRMVKG
jgi:hypothetical protein